MKKESYQTMRERVALAIHAVLGIQEHGDWDWLRSRDRHAVKEARSLLCEVSEVLFLHTPACDAQLARVRADDPEWWRQRGALERGCFDVRLDEVVVTPGVKFEITDGWEQVEHETIAARAKCLVTYKKLLTEDQRVNGKVVKRGVHTFARVPLTADFVALKEVNQ
ncbi:MAG: hypothetical protein LBK60_02465 [Verrucomicrobiales bacterium]|jgi:hypothetical protein|nr:hypothetical protein [Verrucomicrobiales bacterium]